LKIRVLLSCLLVISFPQYTVANECSSDEEQHKYVVNFMETFRAYSKEVQNVEASIRKQLSEKADEYAKSGLIT